MRNDDEKITMKSVTIYLPSLYVRGLNHLYKMGRIANRSEGIRMALFEFLVDDNQLIVDLMKN